MIKHTVLYNTNIDLFNYLQFLSGTNVPISVLDSCLLDYDVFFSKSILEKSLS